MTGERLGPRLRGERDGTGVEGRKALVTGASRVGRAATSREVAWMAAFLASDLSAFTTGSIITVDGGGTSRRSAL